MSEIKKFKVHPAVRSAGYLLGMAATVHGGFSFVDMVEDYREYDKNRAAFNEALNSSSTDLIAATPEDQKRYEWLSHIPGETLRLLSPDQQYYLDQAYESNVDMSESVTGTALSALVVMATVAGALSGIAEDRNRRA